ETNSPPVLPIISPCVIYFRRSDLILPRTICLNRLASRSIFRTTAVWPSPLDLRPLRTIAPKVAADRPEAQHFAARTQRSTEPKNKRSLGDSPGNEGSRWVEDGSECVCPVIGARDPGSPTANCIPRPRSRPRPMHARFHY